MQYEALSFQIDVLECDHCRGRMRIVAAVTDPASVRRYLEGTGQSADVDCGRPMAVLVDPAVPVQLRGRRPLRFAQLQQRVPTLAPARAPPQTELDFDL